MALRELVCGAGVAAILALFFPAAGCSSDSDTPYASGPVVMVDDIPTGDGQAMNEWLHKKPYASWPHESGAHPSTGPHAAAVLTYVNPKLDASLSSHGASHPKGSAAVKEFLSNGQVSGWAAYVKTQDESAGGDGFFWYEVFDSTPGARGSAAQGNPTCTGCHSTGADFVRSPYPLQ
jgi:hypothetical protein